MKVLKFGMKKQDLDAWSYKLTCGENAETGCGAELEVTEKDLYRVKQQVMAGLSISFKCLCPVCGSENGVPYQQIPDEGRGVEKKSTWLRNARTSLLLQLKDQAEDWTVLRRQIVTDGIPEEVLEQLKI